MSTAHWLQGGGSGAWTAGTPQPNIDIVIPAGATVKRFMLRQVSFSGYATGTDFNSLAPLHYLVSVDIIAGEYSPRNIYLQDRRLPSEFCVYFKTTAVKPDFTQYVGGGDQDLGFNQRCSYGTAGGPGMTFRMASGVFAASGALNNPAGNWNAQFRVLYLI
jgi:hypothetical protein